MAQVEGNYKICYNKPYYFSNRGVFTETKKCIKCGSEIGEGNAFCSACGAKQNKPKKSMKLLIPIIAAVVVVLVVVAIFVFNGGNSIVKTSEKLIEDDLGTSISVKDVYYNEDEEVCVVKFVSKGETDFAMIFLEDESIYYESVLDTLTDPFDYILYGYDVVMVYNALEEKNGWEKIY